MTTPPSTTTIDIPAVTKIIKKRVMVTPPTTRTITIPEVTTTIKRSIPAVTSTNTIEIPEVTTTMRRTVMTSAPSSRLIKGDATYKTIKKTVLVKDAWEEEVQVAAKYKTITKEILVSKGGLTSWKEVECKLVVNTPLPINWNLGSATLTSGAKRIIDARLLPILKDGLAVAIESHTDSRGTKKNNQSLSERRAQAVVNYLIAKRINPSQLTANGYGENRLTNRCSDGVSCTEREHASNRRTTFRVINQK
jgi:outer membrane protein OmpA-like peptidoglycan-associated protein